VELLTNAVQTIAWFRNVPDRYVMRATSVVYVEKNSCQKALTARDFRQRAARIWTVLGNRSVAACSAVNRNTNNAEIQILLRSGASVAIFSRARIHLLHRSMLPVRMTQTVQECGSVAIRTAGQRIVHDQPFGKAVVDYEREFTEKILVQHMITSRLFIEIHLSIISGRDRNEEPKMKCQKGIAYVSFDSACY